MGGEGDTGAHALNRARTRGRGATGRTLRRRRIAATLVGAIVVGTGCGDSPANDSPVLVGGRGIDHVGVAVRDLAAARVAYTDSLGFRAAPEAKLPTGLENVTIWFADTTYLELLTYYDRERAPEIAAILERYEGGLFAGLDVGSAQATKDFLVSRGIDVEGPVSGSAAIEPIGEPVEMWRHLTFRQPVVPANAVFFIQYNREKLAEMSRTHPEFSPLIFTDHANGARGMRSVWMAVTDLQSATAAYEKVGFTPGRALEVPQLGATGREILAGRGRILLLAPSRVDGIVASFLRQRGEGVAGVSLEVADLAAARQVLAARSGLRFATYEGPYGVSVLIPPELTHGLWMEMVEIVSVDE